MIERFMAPNDLSKDEEALYQAAVQVRGGVDVETVLKWYPNVKQDELLVLLQELDEYDNWRSGGASDVY
jgi:hypothetical protein